MKKFLLSIFTLFCILATANADTYTHIFSKGELTTTGGTFTFSDIEWKASTATVIDWNATKGIQIGNKEIPNTSYTLSTSGFVGCTIRSITVNSSIAASGDATLTIKVGSQESEAYKPKTSDAAYTFDCEDTTGDITISWSASQRAYYVKSITIDYAPNASTVVIPTPEFKTPAVVYADKIENVTVETTDQSAAIYYTTDGTDPVYEDYINETGTTKSSRTYVMYFDLTETTTIKAMAVRTDGDAVFKSGIAEQTYIVSRTMPYLPASSITSGSKYAMIAADSAATYYYRKEAQGALPSKTATYVNSKYTNAVECAGFTFTAKNGGYTIQDELGRYLSPADNGFSYATNSVWNVTTDSNGYASITCNGKTIYYSTADATFGCHATATADHILPKLYVQREYPQYTVTPVTGTTMVKLETITVQCEEGIAATNDLNVEAEGFSTKFTVSQPNSKTLVLTANEPIISHNNYDLNINITAGDIILNPEVMEMSLPVPVKYGVRTIAKYTITGDAQAAVIEEITPASGAKVKELSHFVFTFSYYASHTDNTEISPKLHLEGSDELIALEKSVTKEDGSYIGMLQAALKTVEPVTANGTYILEIPTGYFCDGNGKDIEGITLKYIVDENTAIEDIIANENGTWKIYNIGGIKVLETEDADKIEALPTGVYIINGIKTVIK